MDKLRHSPLIQNGSLASRVIPLILALTLSTGAFAQQTPTIVEIEVTGARQTSADLIKSVAALLPGSALNTTAIRDAVIRLDGLALFEDVSVLVEEADGGVKLYIVVKERARLKALTYNGADKLKKNDLDDAVKLKPGAHVSGFTIFSKKQAILRAYADKGFFLTEVDYSLEYSPDSLEVSVTFNITENEKIKVRDVFITGAVRMEPEELVGVMSNRKKGFLRSSNYNKDKYDEDLEKIIAEYHKNGFIDAYLISDSIRIDSVANRMDIYLATYEGPRYYFGNATFTDNDVYTDNQLARALKFSSLDVFDQEKYEESIF
ncbi:MAG: POTRA domain-containing protein [Candidatus Zixiibacteriota bacterium]